MEIIQNLHIPYSTVAKTDETLMLSISNLILWHKIHGAHSVKIHENMQTGHAFIPELLVLDSFGDEYN